MTCRIDVYRQRNIVGDATALHQPEGWINRTVGALRITDVEVSGFRHCGAHSPRAVQVIKRKGEWRSDERLPDRQGARDDCQQDGRQRGDPAATSGMTAVRTGPEWAVIGMLILNFGDEEVGLKGGHAELPSEAEKLLSLGIADQAALQRLAHRVAKRSARTR